MIVKGKQQTLSDVKATLSAAKRQDSDAIMARMMLRNGWLTDEAREHVAKEYPQPMFLQIGRKRYEVTSFEQASAMFCTARDKSGLGASSIKPPLIVDGDGRTVGHVSYNGRVWPGASWHPGMVPLYG